MEKGEITPLPCETCGNPKTHAHHDDYSKPLEIRWLCTGCHSAHHKAMRIRNGIKRSPAFRGGLKTYQPTFIKSRMRKTTVYPWHHHYYPAPQRERFLDEARRLRSQGLSYKAIATRIGVNKGQVYKWLNPKPEYG